VRNETQDEERMMAYAREIGADESAFREAYRRVPVMSREKFELVAQTLFVVANQLSTTAYQNVQQARFITERKQAEIRISEQAALLDAANDAIYVRALDHTITYWNDGAERLFEIARAGALGCKITDHYYSGLEAFETAHAALLKQGGWSGELKRKNQAGREMVMFCRWTLLHDEQGRPKEVLAITTDITEQKRLEASFLRAQRMEGLGALAGGIAHDLNNILQPILMTVPMLIESATAAENRELLETVESCARRGADIIRQLLTFARGTPGDRVPLRVRHLLGEMDKIIHETFPRNIHVAVEAPPDLWLVMGDVTQIHQALMNLCVNARDAMPDGGRITLAAANQVVDEAFAAMTSGARPGPHVCVSVTDTGTGIPPEVQERIFDPFFTTKEIGKGTGLGLATVLGIMRGHGGFVRMSSQVGEGTRFELYFPASLKTQTDVAASEPTLPPRAAGELILVVDDEASVRKVIQRILERHGYQVMTASEGGEALALFARHQKEIRAVITDMMMPGMDGPTVVRLLRQQQPHLPIIGMTGIGRKADIKGLREEDLTLLLAKPFGGANLIETLHRILPASNSPRGIA
jgi:PAS domain S-box-containing protein